MRLTEYASGGRDNGISARDVQMEREREREGGEREATEGYLWFNLHYILEMGDPRKVLVWSAASRGR
jgi:hypothetical protein